MLLAYILFGERRHRLSGGAKRWKRARMLLTLTASFWRFLPTVPCGGRQTSSAVVGWRFIRLEGMGLAVALAYYAAR